MPQKETILINLEKMQWPPLQMWDGLLKKKVKCLQGSGMFLKSSLPTSELRGRNLAYL